MIFTTKAEYGVRLLIQLGLDESPPTSLKAVAEAEGLPLAYLERIAALLKKADLVRSTRGAHGGYALARPAREVSFLDVIEAVEGPVVVNVCQDGSNHDSCKATGSCTMYGVWKLGQQRMLEVYRHTTLDRLAMSDLRMPEPPPPVVRPVVEPR